jgi:hypothetical protein
MSLLDMSIQNLRLGFENFFLFNPSAPTSHQKPIYHLLHSKRLAKNPLFEAILLLIPTGPLLYQFFLEWFYQDIYPLEFLSSITFWASNNDHNTDKSNS